MAGLSTYPQRKALFEAQRAHVEAKIVRMNRTLDMQKFKCWYYEQAIRDGGEDYVISIHMNGFTESDAYGAQVLYQTGSAEGMALAQTIQEELRGGLDVTNRRQASAGDYMVLRSASVPAVLVECGFLSNAAEEEKLMTPAYQERIAWLIYTGLMRYAAGRQNV